MGCISKSVSFSSRVPEDYPDHTTSVKDSANDPSAYQYWQTDVHDGVVNIDRVKEGTYRLTVAASGEPFPTGGFPKRSNPQVFSLQVSSETTYRTTSLCEQENRRTSTLLGSLSLLALSFGALAFRTRVQVGCT